MRDTVIMVYPLLGLAGAFVKHAPLGLLYASTELVKQGVKVKIFDARLRPRTWEQDLEKLIDENTLAVGISVMTGKPILSALSIGRFVKSLDSEISVIWGGPFATFHPDFILRDDKNCDYVVSGYGSLAMGHLVRCLLEGEKPEGIQGVYYRDGDDVRWTPADWSQHEFIHHKDIPYHLIEDYSPYGQLDQKWSIFSLYSAMGCAYNCAFCSSPALYDKIVGKRWVPYPVQQVVDHVEYVVERYGADYIYFIDDDSFVSLKHVEDVIDEVNRRGIDVRLGFRGARINEIMKMDDLFIDKLVKAGVDIMHVGAESGSNRILELVKKNCTVDDIIECNKKLARQPNLNVFYNFIIGLPTETVDELKATCRLMLQLIEENPRAIIGTPNLFRPLPGTKLFELAKKEWGYASPRSLKEFSDIEVEGDQATPWYSPEFKKLCEVMLVTSYFVDDKIATMTTGENRLFSIINVLGKLYRPFARLRLKYGYTGFFIEGWAYKIAAKLLSGVRTS